MKKLLKLTESNYYGEEANREYFSASQCKSWDACPARTLAELNGDYKSPESRALELGRYMDALWSPDEMDELMLEARPKYYKKDGTPRADVEALKAAYERAHRDPMFCHFVEDGEHQTIMTGEIAGEPFKIKMDSYFPDEMIVDLKYMKDMKPMYKDGEKQNFIAAWGYDKQLSIYQKIVSQNNGGLLLPCFIACITKETVPQIEIIEVPQWRLDSVMTVIEHDVPIYAKYKSGEIPAPRCGHCDYCHETYKIEKPKTYEQLMIETAEAV